MALIYIWKAELYDTKGGKPLSWCRGYRGGAGEGK